MQDALGSVQSVLVLGGGSDIAPATLRKLVQRRARTIVLAARDPESLAHDRGELRASGATSVEMVPFDARDTASARRASSTTCSPASATSTSRCSPSACSASRRKPSTTPRRRRHRDVNYVGMVSMAVPLAQRMRAQGHGTIVALSSVAGERARRSNFVYGSSKAGMDAFFQGLGDSLVGTGVHVMIVRPGFVHTKMTDGMDAAPLSTTPEAVADAIVRGLARGQRDRVGAGDSSAT